MTHKEMRNLLRPIRIVRGPFGPHYAKKEFYAKGKWHYLKWATPREVLVDIIRAQD